MFLTLVIVILFCFATILGFALCAVFTSGKISDLEEELLRERLKNKN